MKIKLFLLLVLLYFNTTVAQTVSTLAGQSRTGSTNGTGTAATFSGPYGVATDASGNVYVADTNNNLIRKITPAGVVTTLAGQTAAGSINGTGTAAKFNGPAGVATDASGNVYVADRRNSIIRKITIDNKGAVIVSTLAGSGVQGFADGSGTAAQFYTPSGVATDASGNVYVADTYNYKIRKITIDSLGVGVVSTLAGSTAGYADDTGTAAQFRLPTGVAIDASGKVYVADYGNQRIRKITIDNAGVGTVSTYAGSGVQGFADGTGTAAQFNSPTGVATDASGNVYVADTGNQRIRQITPGGVVTTYAGQKASGFTDDTGTNAKFNSPTGVATDTSGNVYVADIFNNRIRKITPPATLGVNQTNSTAYNVSLYPNPAATILNIKVDKLEANTIMTITDVLGQTIYTQAITNALTTINTSAFAKGVYFVTIQSPAKKTLTKFLVN